MAGQLRIARIVWVALVMLATFVSVSKLGAGPVSVSRLSSSLGPLRLSASERREYGAWSRYGTGVYLGLSSGGRLAFLDGIEEALLQMPHDAGLRRRWEESVGMLKLSPKEASRRFRPIYECAPGDVDVVILYARLLRDSDDKAEAERVLGRGIELTGGRDGLLLRDYVLICSLNGKLRGALISDEGPLWHRLSSSLGFKELRHRDALRAGIGYFWLCQSDRLMERLGQEGLSASEREKLTCGRSSLHGKAVSIFKEISLEKTDSMTCYLVCQTYEAMGLYRELQGALSRLDGFAMNGTWWLEFSFKAAAVLHDYKNVCAYLDRVRFHAGMHEELLRRSIQAYLAVGGRGKTAIRLARLLVKKDPKRETYRQILAYVLASAGHLQESLSTVDGIPASHHDLSLIMLRSRLLHLLGRVTESYEYLLRNVRSSEISLKELSGVTGQKAERQTLMLRSFLVDAYERLGLLCIGRKDMGESLKWIRRHHALAPESAAACNLYGYMLADMNQDLPLAERLIRQALKKEPDNVAFLDSLSWVHFRQGRYGEALKVMVRVMELGGLSMDSDGEMRGHLRQIFDKLGMPETATLYELEMD